MEAVAGGSSSQSPRAGVREVPAVPQTISPRCDGHAGWVLVNQSRVGDIV